MTKAQHELGGEGAENEARGYSGHRRGSFSAVISVLALAFSGYSLWDSSLKAPDLKVFVPPVIQFTAPYNNTNFEVVEVPVTLLNDGGRTGTALSMDLEVTNPKTGEVKRFYAADLGRWTMDKARANGFDPFAPIPLAGKSSKTETVLFYTNGPAQKPDQIIREPGTYGFRLVLDEADVNEFGPIDKIFRHGPAEVEFNMELRNYDARAFQTGTLPLYSTSGRSAKGGSSAQP
ncbi:hypothetical protein [Hyphomicrobium sp.]|jgi:hypothetical protein|uniref:hypothetical protein n=1 Tax=Hyphomicrobium sp. TaxID=82 RepID=UPI0035687A90